MQISFQSGKFEGEVVPSEYFNSKSTRVGGHSFLAVLVGQKEESRLLEGGNFSKQMRGEANNKPKGWFNDEIIDLGVGILWMGLLTPCFALHDRTFHCTNGRSILDPWDTEEVPNVGREQSRAGPTLCFSSRLWCHGEHLHKKLTGNVDGKAKGSKHTASIAAESDVEEVFTATTPSSFDEEVEAMSTPVRRDVRHVLAHIHSEMGLLAGIDPADLKDITYGNLWDFVKDHRADSIVFPACIENEHWVFVAVTGLTEVLPVLEDRGHMTGIYIPGSESGPAWRFVCGSDRSANSQKFRVTVLDSFESPLVVKARSDPQVLLENDNIGTQMRRMKRKSGARKMKTSANSINKTSQARKGNLDESKSTSSEVPWKEMSVPSRIIDVVMTILANEWQWKSRSGDTRSNDTASLAVVGNFVKGLRNGRGKLMSCAHVSIPAVPQQKDYSQCGPMTILAMQAFCENEAFRRYCLNASAFPCEGIGTSGFATTRAPNPGEACPKAYSFEASSELRGKLLYFVRKLKEQAAQSE